MASQEDLKHIRDCLYNTFSYMRDFYSVTSFVEAQLRRFLVPLLTDARCNEIYNEAVKKINEDVSQKYNKIADKIKEYLKELDSISFENGCISYSSNSDSNLLKGAAAGLGASLLLSGPLLPFVGIGLLAGAFINSKNKKEVLVNKIIEASKKLNEEAINNISPKLDQLILPESKTIFESEIFDDDISGLFVEVLTNEQKEIKKFLESRNINYLVHFTDKKNYESIKANGILSINRAKQKNINIKVNDNDISSHNIEKRLNVEREDYISLSVSSVNRELLSAYRFNHNINNFVILYIDASILWKEIGTHRIYCDRNASCSSVRFGNKLENFRDMFVDNISYMTFEGRYYDNDRARDGTNSNQTTNPRAEIWFYGEIDYKKYVVKCEEL